MLTCPDYPNLLPSATHLPSSYPLLSSPKEDAVPSPSPVSSSVWNTGSGSDGAMLQCSEALLDCLKKIRWRKLTLIQ